MIWSFPWSVPFGNHEDFIDGLSTKPMAGGVRAIVKPATNYGMNYQIEVDGLQGQIKNISDTNTGTLQGYWQHSAPHNLSILPLGDWLKPDFDLSAQSLYYLADKATKISLTIPANPKLFSFNDSGQLTNWTLTGIKRFVNLLPVDSRKTWGEWSIVLNSSGSLHTLQLFAYNALVASGSITGSGTITLNQENDSGLSGTVHLSYSGAISNGVLIADYPAQYKIYYKNTGDYASLSDLGPAQGTVNDSGTGLSVTYTSDRLPEGNYSIVVHSVDEDGNESTGLTNYHQTITYPPAPPSLFSFVSGNSVRFVASTTSGVSYNLYDSGVSSAIDYSTAIPLTVFNLNLLGSPEDYTNSGWTKVNAAITNNANIAPDVTKTGAKFKAVGGAGSISQSVSISGNTVYTYSIFVKQSGNDDALGFIFNDGINTTNISWHFSTETMTLNSGSMPYTFKFEKYASKLNWYRLEFALTTSIGATSLNTRITNAINKSVILWGSQLEKSPSVSDYYSVFSGKTALAASIPAISGSFTGIRTVNIRAEKSGIEDGNMDVLPIEYVAGVGIQPRPNKPLNTSNLSTSGRVLTVNATLNRISELTAPAALNLYLWAIGGSPDYATPSGSASLDSSLKVYNASVSGTASSNGLYFYNIRAISKDGILSENATDSFGPILLTNSVPIDPSSILVSGV